MASSLILIILGALAQASNFINFLPFKPNLVFVVLLTLIFFETNIQKIIFLSFLSGVLIKFPNALSAWPFWLTIFLPIFFFYLKKFLPFNLYFNFILFLIAGTALTNLGFTAEIFYNLAVGFLVFLYLNWSYGRAIA